jgi:hypothetical protein
MRLFAELRQVQKEKEGKMEYAIKLRLLNSSFKLLINKHHANHNRLFTRVAEEFRINLGYTKDEEVASDKSEASCDVSPDKHPRSNHISCFFSGKIALTMTND